MFVSAHILPHERCIIVSATYYKQFSLPGLYLGDEYAVVLKQVVAVVATGQQLPDFSSEWLRNATANQRWQTLRTSGQVPMPDTNTKKYSIIL